ncbi:MAG: hypothetical protein AAGD96_10990, partial [Chloroflexota bacterium]
QKELRFNESFTIGLRMTAPTGPNAAGSLFQLLSPGNNMFYAEVDENGIWFKFIDIANSSGNFSQSRGVYAPFGVSPGEPVFVACVWDIARESGKVLKQGSSDEEDQDKNRDGTMSIFINGSKGGEVPVEWCGYHDITLFNLGKPGTDEEFKKTQSWIKELQEKGFLEKKKDDPNFTVVPGENYSKGCQTRIFEVRVWEQPLDESQLTEPFYSQYMPLYWDMSKVTTHQSNEKDGDSIEKLQVSNSPSSTQSDSDNKFAPSWNLITNKTYFTPGFRLNASVADRKITSYSTIQLGQWSHLAAVCTGNQALSFNPARPLKQRGYIKDGNGLNFNKAFTIASPVCWHGSESGQRQFILSKANQGGKDAVFTFGIEPDGKPFLFTNIINGYDRPENIHVYAPANLEKNKNYYLVARIELKSISWSRGQDFYEAWHLDGNIYVFNLDSGQWSGEEPNDVHFATTTPLNDAYDDRKKINQRSAQSNLNSFLYISEKNSTNSKIRIKQADIKVSLGSYTADGETADQMEQGWFNGLIGNMLVWDKAITDTEIKRLTITANLAADVSKPVAHWKFDEGRGLSAADSANGLKLTLTDEEMWVNSRLTARLALFIDGRSAAGSLSGSGSSVAYGVPDRLTFSGYPILYGPYPGYDDYEDQVEYFKGQLDDLRIWDDLRSQEDIYDNRHVLLNGNEHGLTGFWPISTASGSVIRDKSGHINHARVNSASWTTNKDGKQTKKIEPISGDVVSKFWVRDHAAPTGHELPQIRNLLDGPANAWTVKSGVNSTAAEYGDLQMTPAGVPKGAMKRTQVYLDAQGTCHTITGYKVGDLDLNYLGQAQSDPTLIGYIEGAPPVPSENATRAYYTSAARYTAYDDASSVRLTEAENSTQIYSADIANGLDLKLEMGRGFAANVELESGFAFGGYF